VQSFLDVVLPPLLAMAFGGGLCVIAAVVGAARMRLWAARRRQLAGARDALAQAADVLSAVISDPGVDADLREQAVTAYAAVVTATPKENPIR